MTGLISDRIPRVLLVVLVVAHLSGCGGKTVDQPELGQVTGTILLGGKPLEGARVYFTPAEGGRTAEGVTDAEGRYDLIYLRDMKGAKIGENAVRITTFEAPEIDDAGKASGGRKEEVPTDYAEGKTHNRTVEAGKNSFDFDITP